MKKSRPCRLYTPEQAQFLREGFAGKSVAELTALFNARFEENKTKNQIRSFVRNRGITSGLNCCFEKGATPWNLNKKGYMGANKTSFIKGSIPPNRKPIGTERIDSKDGFILVKIAERNPYTGTPTRYKHKHVHVYETIHGPLPKGHVVSFKDGNRLNCDPENLMLLTRAELLILNQHDYKNQPAEMKPTILALVKVEAKAGFRTSPARGRKKS